MQITKWGQRLLPCQHRTSPEQCLRSLLCEPRSSRLAMFSSYQEGCTYNFSLHSLPFGLHACQMFVKLPQSRSAMLVCRLAPAVTCERGGHCPVALFMYTQIPYCSYTLKTCPLQLWRGHTARTPGHQGDHGYFPEAFQADDLEDISLTSLSGPVVNMGCNISCSFWLELGMSSRGSKWQKIHPVPWGAALPALHYSSAQKRAAYFLCWLCWFPNCSPCSRSCLWLLDQRFILYQSFSLHKSPNHLLTC